MGEHLLSNHAIPASAAPINRRLATVDWYISPIHTPIPYWNEHPLLEYPLLEYPLCYVT